MWTKSDQAGYFFLCREVKAGESTRNMPSIRELLCLLCNAMGNDFAARLVLSRVFNFNVNVSQFIFILTLTYIIFRHEVSHS